MAKAVGERVADHAIYMFGAGEVGRNIMFISNSIDWSRIMFNPSRFTRFLILVFLLSTVLGAQLVAPSLWKTSKEKEEWQTLANTNKIPPSVGATYAKLTVSPRIREVPENYPTIIEAIVVASDGDTIKINATASKDGFNDGSNYEYVTVLPPTAPTPTPTPTPTPARDIVLLEHTKAYTDVHLSTERVKRAKSFAGAWDTAAGIFAIAVIKELNLDELIAEALMNEVHKIYIWLSKMEEACCYADPKLYIKLVAVYADVLQTAFWIWRASNGWKIKGADMYEDGSMDFHAIWTMGVLEQVTESTINIYLEFTKYIVSEKLSNFNAVALQKEGHKLYLSVNYQNHRIDLNYKPNDVDGPFYFERETTVAVLLPPQILEFSYVVDAKEAASAREEYTMSVFTIRDGAIIDQQSETYMIKREETQEFQCQISAEDKVIPKEKFKSLPSPTILGLPLDFLLGIAVVIGFMALIVISIFFIKVRKNFCFSRGRNKARN